MVQKMIISAICIGFFIFIGGMAEGMTIWINVKSSLLVLGGSVIGALLAYPVKRFQSLGRSLKAAFQDAPDEHLRRLIEEISHLTRIRRLYGPMELGTEGNKSRDPFIRKGIDLIVDNYQRYELHHIMEKEVDAYLSGKASEIGILVTMGRLAPAFGFMGTILGLMNVLGRIDMVSQIGQGVALAFSTTLYGLLLGHFIFLSLADKLSEYVKAEEKRLNLVLEGVLDIFEAKNPFAVSHRLGFYIDPAPSSELAADPDPDDADTEPSRLSTFFMKLWPRKEHVRDLSKRA